MDEQTAINYFLSRNSTSNGLRYFSACIAALRDARQASGRDMETGEIIYEKETGSWLGAVGYFIFLDQIGEALKIDTVNIKGKNTIKNALLSFSSVSETDAKIIYALRCAFAHDFSLYNNKQKIYTFAFIVLRSKNDKLIEPSKKTWDGVITTSIADEYKTTVNLCALGEICENIYKKLLQLNKDKKLKIKLEGGWNELMARYMLVTGI